MYCIPGYILTYLYMYTIELWKDANGLYFQSECILILKKKMPRKINLATHFEWCCHNKTQTFEVSRVYFVYEKLRKTYSYIHIKLERRVLTIMKSIHNAAGNKTNTLPSGTQVISLIWIYVHIFSLNVLGVEYAYKARTVSGSACAYNWSIIFSPIPTKSLYAEKQPNNRKPVKVIKCCIF